MLIDGKKVACATCIKGHRASQCRHKDRQLIEIKKKGRPATQCERCRELRLVRQLHVKCDCNDTKDTSSKPKLHLSSGIKKPCHSNKLATLRAIAPKPVITKEEKEEEQPQQLEPQPEQQQQHPHGDHHQHQEGRLCKCAEAGAKKCCSKEKINDEGQKIRIVTCRCGDSCACPGCDAHPSRVMRGKQDPYTGYAASFDLDPRRRLSIAAICDQSDGPTPDPGEERPTLIFSEDGTRLCGCGCDLPFESCSNCLGELCRGATYDVPLSDA